MSFEEMLLEMRKLVSEGTFYNRFVEKDISTRMDISRRFKALGYKVNTFGEHIDVSHKITASDMRRIAINSCKDKYEYLLNRVMDYIRREANRGRFRVIIEISSNEKFDYIVAALGERNFSISEIPSVKKRRIKVEWT